MRSCFIRRLLARLSAHTAATCCQWPIRKEGSFPFSAYPEGHGTVVGACVTMLKAFFNESFVIPNPVEASSDGFSLTAYTGPSLTVGGELNKLAANVSIGRDIAGVHWRSDGDGVLTAVGG